MKKFNTVKQATAFCRSNPNQSATADWDDNGDVKVAFSSCFSTGHLLYTAQVYGVVYTGFLCPEDNFHVNECRPKLWGTYNYDNCQYSNFASADAKFDLVEYHQNSLKRLREYPQACPGRLRRKLLK